MSTCNLLILTVHKIHTKVTALPEDDKSLDSLTYPLVSDSPVNDPLTTPLTVPRNSGNWAELHLQKMASNHVATMRYILVCTMSTIKFPKFFFPWPLWICNGPVCFVLTLTALHLSLFTLVLLIFHFLLTKNRLLKNRLSFSAVKKDNFKASLNTCLQKSAADSSNCKLCPCLRGSPGSQATCSQSQVCPGWF